MTFKEAIQNGLDVKQMVMGGMISDAYHKRVFALNPAVVGSLASVCLQGGVYANPASASVLTIVSTSVDDDSAGTGARTVVIEGLDANYQEVSETVIMDGTTPVTTTNTFIRVFGMSVDTAGSATFPAGNITAKIDATIYSQLTAGYNLSYNSNYTVPAGKTAYVIHGGTTSSAATVMSVSFKMTPFGKAQRNIHTIDFYQRPYDYEFAIGMPIEAKTDLDVTALGTTTSSKVTATYDLIIVG